MPSTIELERTAGVPAVSGIYEAGGAKAPFVVSASASPGQTQGGGQGGSLLEDRKGASTCH